jgi:hypothetical protein
MNKRFACHYSVARFCPYPETDEFVNIGVVLACPLIGYLDFRRADLRRRGRVGRFFPELDANIYSAAMNAWEDSLAIHRRVPADGQTLNDLDQKRQREMFRNLVRPRESILYYSEPRVILSENLEATLDEIFGVYVERRFANAPEYQEKVMCRRLETVFRDADLLQRYDLNHQVGNEDYHVRFPFVSRAVADARPRQAIKALHLDRKNPTDIIRHADDWRNVVHRLKDYGTAPDEMLFVLQGPTADNELSRQRAFDRVLSDLTNDNIPHVTADATSVILSFAMHDA